MFESKETITQDVTLITVSEGDSALYLGRSCLASLDPSDSNGAAGIFDMVKHTLKTDTTGIFREVYVDLDDHDDIDNDEWDWNQVSDKVFGTAPEEDSFIRKLSKAIGFYG
jgi:hypothetical protein